MLISSHGPNIGVRFDFKARFSARGDGSGAIAIISQSSLSILGVHRYTYGAACDVSELWID